MIPAPAPFSPDPSSGGRLVSNDGQLLPLVGARLHATARGGVAEVVLEQRFRNAGTVPLAVTYSFPLPADAAVGGYAFTIGDRRIVGEIDRRQAARERFEQALVEGRTAGLVEQERSSLFSQELGNIPPGTDVVAELTLDQRLRWLDEGAWEWRFPTTAAPRYLGATGRVADAARVSQEIADGPLPARLTLALAINEPFTAAPESPSHRVRATAGAVRFDDDAGVPLDRDLVVRWPVARAAAGLALEVSHPQGTQAYGLLTLTPPAKGAPGTPLPRDLIVLLDTSGSMGGAPLDQARRVVSALIDTLGERDRLELIEFSSAPRRWKAEPVAATAAMRREALAWLGKLRASGGTEMREGILEALRPLRGESQRQIVLVTDGLIGFEQEVVGAIVRGLPASSRVHTVGVGSAVNRSLTSAAARAGRGLEVMTGLDEDVERAARRLVARTDAPLVVELSLAGSALVAHAPAALPDLFAGAPALISLELRPEGGTLEVRGRTATGEWQQTIEVPARAPGQGSRATVRLFGRERIEDLETRVAAGEDHDGEIERLGLAFQVATRLTSWIAVSEEVTVDPNAPTRRVRMPQELPHGMSVEGLGLRGGQAFASGMMRGVPMMAGAAPMIMRQAAAGGPPPSPAQPGFLSRAKDAVKKVFRTAPSDDESFDLAEVQEEAPEVGRRFRGRVTLRTGERLVVQFEVDGDDLDWEPGTEVELVFGDGRRLTAQVLQSTSAGRIRTGEGIRLVIELAPGESQPSEVLIGQVPRIGVRLLPRTEMNDLDQDLAAIQSGDTSAFERWVAAAEATVRLSLRSFAAVVDTEAVLQETLLRTWQVAPRFVSDGRENGLLRLAIRIARNLAISERRRVRADAFDPTTHEPPVEDAAVVTPDPLLRQLIALCREQLEGRPAQALEARLAAGGAEPDEVLAERLSMRLNTFLQNFTRARRLLAECLERRGVDLARELG